MQKTKERLVICLGSIWRKTYSTIIVLLSISGTFFTIFPLGLNQIKLRDRILIVLGIVILSSLIGLVGTLIKREVTIKNYDNRRLKLCYGDLLRIAFKSDDCKKIVVIPVNRCFDTIVDDKVIAKGSIHGQWVDKSIIAGMSISELDDVIEKRLKNIPHEKLLRSQKPKGKLKRYPLGTVVEIKNGNTIFYLLALTWMDENLTVHCTKQEYLNCLQNLVDYYDNCGYIMPIYIPLMGCGISRINLKLKEAVEAMIFIWKINSDKIHADINIVIYEKQKNVLSITDFLEI